MIQTYPYPTPTFGSVPWAVHQPDADDWHWAVIDAACDLHSVTESRLRGPSTARRYSRPRQIAMAALRALSGLSLEQVGKRFDRDHTTVRHACERWEGTRELAAVTRRARQIAGGQR